MKRVINGRSYNTDTATIVAKWSYIDPNGYDTDATLYQNRGGAFFTVHEWTVPDGNEGKTKVYFEPMAREEVDRLVERTDGLEILASEVLADPPEAAVNEPSTTTMLLRLPPALKARIDNAAAFDGGSINAWMLRCAERCLTQQSAGLINRGVTTTSIPGTQGSTDRAAGLINRSDPKA